MKYQVLIPEVHYSVMLIEANSPEDAKLKVSNGEGVEEDIFYSYTIQPDEIDWVVTEREN